MEKLVCKYCGGNQFREEKDAYICTYCHTRYDKFSRNDLRGKRSFFSSGKFVGLAIVLSWLAIFAILGVVISTGKRMNSQNNTVQSQPKAKPSASNSDFATSDSFSEPSFSKSASSTPKYTEAELANPERNVLEAILSLDKDELVLAKASVDKYGGADTKRFTAELNQAEQERVKLQKNLPTQAENPKKLVPDPTKPLNRLTKNEAAGYFAAYMPYFTQYKPADIIRMWGKPDEILTDDATITKNLGCK